MDGRDPSQDHEKLERAAKTQNGSLIGPDRIMQSSAISLPQCWLHSEDPDINILIYIIKATLKIHESYELKEVKTRYIFSMCVHDKQPKTLKKEHAPQIRHLRQLGNCPISENEMENMMYISIRGCNNLEAW